ncbi:MULTISPECIES: HAD domain-containing protein [unclassified Variovorax]|uniref:HAD domain-containing protein n=1 Tax=unclassified Variovorax TaxID=663243 RepID=UPI0002B6288F|nr:MULTISPECIES: HAD domain-containing protein [unclassified Variovorax]AGF25477.1 hypothetical protein [Variovorax sp. WDL1]PNG50556.1 hypothetical protein CHC06_06180 [Variovorax sp. B2]PNG51425.1 hypothetical protein CHC07_06082 [Variovorax sp. B4]VTU42192.1 hypothetical protein RA8P1_00174 [Variovorax sp. RA8]VTV17724.1 hypothetical protein WDL1P1_00615 [Variovorax sp. WDL1]
MSKLSPPLIFLDFDGVLHPAQGSEVRDFAFAPHLARAVQDVHCEVVISSTWREHYPLPELKRLLPEPLAALVVGTLGADQPGPHVRYKTICRWLVEHRATDRRWCAVDDNGSEFPAGMRELLLCDGMRGFGAWEAECLRDWLLRDTSFSQQSGDRGLAG